MISSYVAKIEKNTTIMRKITHMLILCYDSEMQQQQPQHQHLQHSTSPSVSLVRSNCTKKFLLCLTFLIQFGFMLCFWLMQHELCCNGIPNISFNKNKLQQYEPQRHQQYRVNFIQPGTRKIYANKANRIKLMEKSIYNNKNESKDFLWPSRELDFHKNFILQKNLYNVTENEHFMSDEAATQFWCFREGIQNESTYRNLGNDDNMNNNNIILWQEHCNCLRDWHGRDCGQPEVIWRALMLYKLIMKPKEPNQDERRRLICMIEGNFFNFDLLEIQLKAMDNVVDYFVIYWKRPKILTNNVKSLKQLLQQILIKRNYSLYYCNKIKRLRLKSSSNVSFSQKKYINACTPLAAYHLFRQQYLSKNVVKSFDYFLYIDDFTILGHRALNYLKFYSSSMTNLKPIRFRLKYNVYSFYWQHQNLTHISGVLCSFNYLDDMLGNGGGVNSRAEDLMKNFQRHYYNNNDNFIIGDLNHFAGWFCKYCQQPEQILQELQTTATKSFNESTSTIIAFPRNGHNSYIDINYIKQLIATGTYLHNGKTQLQRQRLQWHQGHGQGQEQDQLGQHKKYYYAPNYVVEQNWKFDYLLENIYETLDDLLTNDYDGTI